MTATMRRRECALLEGISSQQSTFAFGTGVRMIPMISVYQQHFIRRAGTQCTALGYRASEARQESQGLGVDVFGLVYMYAWIACIYCYSSRHLIFLG